MKKSNDRPMEFLEGLFKTHRKVAKKSPEMFFPQRHKSDPAGLLPKCNQDGNPIKGTPYIDHVHSLLFHNKACAERYTQTHPEPEPLDFYERNK